MHFRNFPQIFKLITSTYKMAARVQVPENFDQLVQADALAKIEALEPELCKVLLKHLIKSNYPAGIYSSLLPRRLLDREKLIAIQNEN